MKLTITITTAEILAGDIRPFTKTLASHHRTWFANPGSISICRLPFDGQTSDTDARSAVRRYWIAALRATPWIPFVVDPANEIAVELAYAEIPAEHIRFQDHSPKLVGLGADYLAAIQGRWNATILTFGLMVGTETQALTQHMDALRELLAKSVGVVELGKE